MPDGNETIVLAGSSFYFVMQVNNTDNSDTLMKMDVMQVPNNWSAALFLQGSSESEATDLLEFTIPYEGGAVVLLRITVWEDEDPTTKELLVDVRSLNSDLTLYRSEEVILQVNVERTDDSAW
jgi:hypothetical protein